MPEEKALNGTKQNTEPASPLSGLAPMTKNQVMDIAMDLGKILLKSGAETSRVEDTMMRFCRSYGYYDPAGFGAAFQQYLAHVHGQIHHLIFGHGRQVRKRGRLRYFIHFCTAFSSLV